MNEIESYIESYFGVKEKNLSPVTELFQEHSLRKNEYLLKKGQYTAGLSFVKEGFLRIFAYSDRGAKDITQWISAKGMFVTDLSSLIFHTPARFNIQALTDCELYTISQENYQTLNQQVENWQELEKLFLAKCFITLENRVFSQLSLTAEEKYKELFNNYPLIFQHVPLHYIASMLGMTPETLSRIRKKRIS